MFFVFNLLKTVLWNHLVSFSSTSSGDGNMAVDHLNKSEHLLRICKVIFCQPCCMIVAWPPCVIKHSNLSLQGATSPEYQQLLERKTVISKQLEQMQHKENGESIRLWSFNVNIHSSTISLRRGIQIEINRLWFYTSQDNFNIEFL